MSERDSYIVVESKKVFDGKLVSVRHDRVRMPSGDVVTREVVEAVDAVAVVAIDDEGRVCLVRQYRHPLGEHVWELPAGRMDVEGEPALDAAKRELREEVQRQSDAWSLLTTEISSPGFATERVHIFLAERVRKAAVPEGFEAKNEEREIEVAWRALDEAIGDVTVHKIQDSKTIIGLLLVHAKRPQPLRAAQKTAPENSAPPPTPRTEE